MKKLLTLLILSIIGICFNTSAQTVSEVVKAFGTNGNYSALDNLLKRNGYSYARYFEAAMMNYIYVKNCKIAEIDDYRGSCGVIPSRKSPTSSVAIIHKFDSGGCYIEIEVYSKTIYNNWLNSLKASKTYKLYKDDQWDGKVYKAPGKPYVMVKKIDGGTYTLTVQNYGVY